MCRVVIGARGGHAQYMLDLLSDFQHVKIAGCKNNVMPHPQICKCSNRSVNYRYKEVHMTNGFVCNPYIYEIVALIFRGPETIYTYGYLIRRNHFCVLNFS